MKQPRYTMATHVLIKRSTLAIARGGMLISRKQFDNLTLREFIDIAVREAVRAVGQQHHRKVQAVETRLKAGRPRRKTHGLQK